jgi:hypothetical protein
MATGMGHEAIVKRLLEAGAEKDAQDDVWYSEAQPL